MAEAVATFFLVFVGCGAIAVHSYTGSLGHGGIAAAFGLIVMTMIYTVGDTSGAHLNPAVTLGFLAAGRMKVRDAGFYILAQCLAAIAAAGLLRLIFPEATSLGVTSPHGSITQSIVLEALLTCILMLVILSVATGAKEKGLMAGVAIGATVGMNALWAGPITGGSMNPARSLGPALVSGSFTHLWLYAIGPIVGALIAVALCRLIHEPGQCCKPESESV